VTKDGGVVVWIVGDATINGSETGTSFRQALYFKEIGFNLHDTMIYEKTSPYPANVRYQQDFEYMFVFSKGKPNTFNPIHTLKTLGEIKKILRGSYDHSTRTYRSISGETERLDEAGLKRLEKASKNITKVMSNVWKCEAGYQKSTTDEIAYKHPAIFPEQLAQDHIISWSNEGDLVLDPFMGSGTTAKMAKLNNRNYIGFELSEEYCKIAEKRISETTSNQIELPEIERNVPQRQSDWLDELLGGERLNNGN
jgi:site-specific DNA-methyltransferase (adenine-specific)